jgi:tripeptidyl-peptidase-1
MHFLQFILVGALAPQAAAIPFTNHVVHERRDYVPKSCIKKGRLDGAAELPVRIGMTQSNLGKGHDLLMEV